MRWPSLKLIKRAGQVAKLPASEVNTASGGANASSSRITSARFSGPSYSGTARPASRKARSERVHSAQGIFAGASSTGGSAAAAWAKALRPQAMPSAGRNTRPISAASGYTWMIGTLPPEKSW